MELMRSLGALAEPAASEHARLARLLGLPPAPDPALHERVFLMEAYPYASVYLNHDGMLGGEARDRVAGFWRALEIAPPDEPDHLAALLGLYAALRERESEEDRSTRRDAYRHAAGALLHEHVAPWLGPFLGAVADAGEGFHGEWASLVGRVVAGELDRHPEPDRMPAHLDKVPRLADPRSDGGEAFLGCLLAPVRTGFVLTASSLARLARDLGLGRRVGERRYVLEHLLAQDPAATLGWLGQEAERWTERRATMPAPERVRTFWRTRADASRRLLGELGRAAEAAHA